MEPRRLRQCRSVDVLDDERIGVLQQTVEPVDGDVADGHFPRSRLQAPCLGKMRLAAARRAEHDEGARGPVRPVVDPRHGRLVGGRDEEILASQRRPMGERKRKLRAGHFPSFPK
jgi:hypothetical protein